MGSAKVLGENEDVVRIMSIHKSKGLEFPVVFASGMGKQFNLMDLTNPVLYHEELGFGPSYVNLETRNSYSTLAKEAIKKKVKLETLSEEMRILYVAFTRAKEKLIITGATSNLEKSINSWISSASLDKNIILPSEVLKGKSYLDWIAMALCKHACGKKLRGVTGATIDLINDEKSKWNIKFWTKDLLTVDKSLETVDNFEESEKSNDFKNVIINKEIKRRLDYKYKFIEGAMLPSNISVSDLKKKEFTYGDEIHDTVEVFKEKEVLKPKFLKEEKGLSSAERGTVIHYVMQRLNYDRVNSINEIKLQIEEMVLDNSLTEREASSIWYKKIYNFFNSKLGKRLLKAYKEDRLIKRELPFFTELSSVEYDLELNKDIYSDEKIRLQGIIDCFFEEEDGIVLLDYKTDYVEEGKIDVIVEKYKTQLNYYKNALEKITEKKVKEGYLYLFSIDKEIKLEI